ncbi:MAG TPA: O-acetyl-ADP-ribose deacetylase [Nocardioidaceae bacterium]|nr:O-acetyl-ADP-ribose deacetylase [Nocardioidaceae bacterium]
MDLTVVEGDITQQQVDAIVNAANERMRGGGGVDGAIHRAGGPAILEDCIAKVPDGERLPTGQALATTGGDLPARWVIHVVGPVHGAGTREQLVSCYANALRVADELGARSVAFPLVSAGIYGWPLDDAIRAAVDTIRGTPTEVAEARIVAFARSTYDAVMAAL